MPEVQTDVPKITAQIGWLLALLIVVYSIIAFINLGNMHSPQTAWTPVAGHHVEMDFGQEVYISRVQFMLGARHNAQFSIYASNDAMNWNVVHAFVGGDVFAWHEFPLNITARYVFINPQNSVVRIQELAFRDAHDNILPVEIMTGKGTALFDEQHLVPLRRGFMNSTYFDEIYHPRTGYEYVHGLTVFETTHPPMGKNFIAMSVATLGMTPFAWRLPGTLFGIFMIPLLFFFARLIFKSNAWGLFAAFIFTFDFMHFAQTRLATIDTYVTFFVMAMFFTMYLYMDGIHRNTLKKSLSLLAITGVLMGFAIASKWQGVYGAIGLPIVFFPVLYKLYKRNPREAKITFFSCFGFFILIPLSIYMLSYIPFVNAMNPGVGVSEWVRTVWDNQVLMFTYHAWLVAEHPFSSPWWQWPLNLRPIWLYLNVISDTVRQGISSFGNPAVWWFGIIATAVACFVLFRSLFYRIFGMPPRTSVDRMAERTAAQPIVAFLLIAYAVQFLPWAFITRLTWIYHYFPSVPFVVLIITWFFKRYVHRTWITYAYCILVFVLFVLFYPVLAGHPMNVNFVHTFLRWLPGWVLI